ncbi:MAG: hypothetical protein FWC42_06520 [Proteobacteria bacterium]|nr:hypothetical protein [Pseudomonadota bacterium]
MKHHFFSLFASVFMAAWMACPLTVFGQSSDAALATTPAPQAEAASLSIPAELSAEGRARYEAQMKTLRAQIDATKWQEALTTVEAMNKERPREPQAQFLKTIILMELGRDDEAKRELLTLVADYPELPEPHNNLATLYARKGQYDLARRELELALTAVPDYGIAHANLADLYLQQAIEHYRRAAALAKNSKDSKALLTRAETIQTMLAPTAHDTTAKNADAAKDEKNASKEEKANEKADGKTDKKADGKANEKASKEDDFLLGGCDAPPGFGGKDDDDVFSSNGTCDIHFDEPEEKKEGGDGKDEKTPAPAKAP